MRSASGLLIGRNPLRLKTPLILRYIANCSGGFFPKRGFKQLSVAVGLGIGYIEDLFVDLNLILTGLSLGHPGSLW